MVDYYEWLLLVLLIMFTMKVFNIQIRPNPFLEIGWQKVNDGKVKGVLHLFFISIWIYK